MIIELIKLIFYSLIIVLISKYFLVRILRKIGELLKLKSKTIGNIAGIATSIPELLTVSFSAFTGLISTGAYNILSSNIINAIQYAFSVLLNKNYKELRNRAIKIDLVLVLITIVIPIFMIRFNIENNFMVVPVFIILFIMFYTVTNNAHKLYLHNRDEIKKERKEAEVKVTSNITVEKYSEKAKRTVLIQGIFLVIIAVILYFVGDLLSDTLSNLCRRFNTPEWLLGILLGFITSIPEVITFFESQKHHQDEKEGVIEATSNLLTSNIMNLFIIHSIGILIYLLI